MWKKLLALSILALSALIMLLACGASPEASIIVETVVVEKEGRMVAAEATSAPMPTAEPREALASDTSGGSGLAAPTIPRAERMIIKNAELDLLVADTDVALDSITVIAADYGAYIISSHTWFESEFKFATVRLGVPVTEFENVLRRLRGLAVKVQSEVASGEDVTDQFVDLQSRLRNLEATRDRIREFLDRAETVEEALQVNEQLSQVEAQIEEIQGRMNYLSDRAAYSTIDVALNPQRPTPTPSPTPTPTPTPTPAAWRPGKTFDAASDVLTTMLKGLADALIWLSVVVLPFLVPAALILWLILWWGRRKGQKKPPPQMPSE